ncbi:MAG: lipid II flippase MurJ, partial [Fibrobacter sp.]|nr:lipid II flippase MurJ [Fibrobacter sp.]
DLKTYIQKTIPLVLGIGMAFSNEVFFRFFGSFLPEGATSSVNYALRTMMMIVAVFGQASGVAFYPFLSKMAAQKQFEKMDNLINSVLVKIASFIIPLSLIMMVLSEQIISILFEYGNFTHESTLKTAAVFSIYLTGCFTFSSSMIMTRTFYALQNTLLPMIISTVISLVSIPLYMVFCSFCGAPGIALASVITMTIQFLVLFIVWQKRMVKWRSAKKVTFTIIKIVLISLIGAIVSLLIKKWTGGYFVSGNKLFCSLMISVLAAFPALLIVAIIYEISGVQKIRDTLQLFKRK